MSDTNHILFTLISFITIVIGLILANKLVTKQETKKLILKISAVVTVIIHFSSLYTDYFSGVDPDLERSMILPLYPCNLAMWTLLVLAFMKNTETKVFKFLCVFTFYLGIFGGIIGIVINEIYISDPNLADWGVLKGLLSHATMLYGCLYIVVGGYLKPRVSNMFLVFVGLMAMFEYGIIMIFIHSVFDISTPNIMYILEKPFEALGWLNVATIGIGALLLIFAGLVIYEWIALKKEDRWYTKIKEYIAIKKAK